MPSRLLVGHPPPSTEPGKDLEEKAHRSTGREQSVPSDRVADALELHSVDRELIRRIGVLRDPDLSNVPLRRDQKPRTVVGHPAKMPFACQLREA